MSCTSTFSRTAALTALLAFVSIAGTSVARADDAVRFDSAMVEMPDGVKLSTDIYVPAQDGAYPVILVRTPYSARGRSWLAQGLTPKGYVVVMQNVRGQNGSEGRFMPFVTERQDGIATLEWILKQPWCNGTVGLWGSSYYGYTALELGNTGHPAIKGIFHVSGYSDLGQFMAHGGAFQLQAHLYWYYAYASGQPAPPKEAWPKIFRTTPVRSFFRGAESVLDLADMPYDYGNIKAPVMHVTGWYDYIYPNVLQTYDGLKAASPSQSQRLIVGPWSHNGIINSWTKVGNEEFGPNADAGMDWTIERTAKWFDHTLKGEMNDLSESDPVSFFVMNDNRWIDDTAWPPTNTEYQKWYISKGGEFSTDKPAKNGTDEFVYDPINPVPTLGGANSHFFPENLGPLDQSSLDDRTDILRYTSDPLAKDMTIAGPLTVVLYASTTGKDTDFTAKLSVIRPDGYVRIIEDGIVRGRYLFEGTDSTGYVKPGEVNRYDIGCGATAIALRAGDRLRLDISSSNFPKYDRNPNTGVAPFDATEFVPATQTIHRSPTYPTHVILPVMK